MNILKQLALTPEEINIPRAEANDVFANALQITYFVAGAIAVIVIIVAGIMFATSAGDPNNVTKAKNLLLYGVIGLVLVVIAFAITVFVQGVFA